MKKVLTCAAVAAAVMFAGTADAKFKRVKTEADFVRLIVGKTMTGDNGSVGSILANGTFKGKLKDGRKYHGNWKWSKGHWCRAGVMDGKAFKTDCQRFEVDGNAYRFTRNKGKGDTSGGTLK